MKFSNSHLKSLLLIIGFISSNFTWRLYKSINKIWHYFNSLFVDPALLGSNTHQQRFLNVAAADACTVDSNLSTSRDDKVWEKFISLIGKCTDWYKVLSQEKLCFLRAILSWISLEYSAVILCSPFLNKRTNAHAILMSRFLGTSGEDMDLVWQDAIYSAGHAEDSQFLDCLTETWKNTFLAMYKHWCEFMKPIRWPIFNCALMLKTHKRCQRAHKDTGGRDSSASRLDWNEFSNKMLIVFWIQSMNLILNLNFLKTK